MNRITSKYIDIPGMNNTRDLGGMRTKDGRTVKPNMLYRSSKLAKLEDKDWFTRNVSLVVDMRSSRETVESPDPLIPGGDYWHLPLFEVVASGAPGTRSRKGGWPCRTSRRPSKACRRYMPAS